jgi:hypothetical protein
MPSNDDRFQPRTVEARYTASDAANFSRQGACMTALPPDETYHLPRIEDLPPPTANSKTNGSDGSKNSCADPNAEFSDPSRL